MHVLKNLCKAFEIKLVDTNPTLRLGGELDEYSKEFLEECRQKANEKTQKTKGADLDGSNINDEKLCIKGSYKKKREN